MKLNTPITSMPEFNAEGYAIPMDTCHLVFIKKGNGLLACGAFDIGALDKFNVPAAKITGVATLEDLLDGTVVSVNQSGQALGLTTGMTGRDALAQLPETDT